MGEVDVTAILRGNSSPRRKRNGRKSPPAKAAAGSTAGGSALPDLASLRQLVERRGAHTADVEAAMNSPHPRTELLTLLSATTPADQQQEDAKNFDPATNTYTVHGVSDAGVWHRFLVCRFLARPPAEPVDAQEDQAWERCIDPVTGKAFYFNTHSEITVREPTAAAGKPSPQVLAFTQVCIHPRNTHCP
jgi:hypothetical protein